ncbi:ThiJ/PfpI [Panaeolus papilionaceus]|nr:ThiJ/PfpI [Panaeolus papilionaceus]
MPSILFVFTSCEKSLTGNPTGWYLPEAAHPYYTLVNHVNIDFASPAGGNPPLTHLASRFNDVTDPLFPFSPFPPPHDQAFEKDELAVKFLNDPTVKQKLETTKKLSEVSVKDYDAVFYVGGHGPVIDLASDPVNAKLVSDFWQSGKIVSAVCHGPAALVGGVDANGKSIFEGRSFTGFSNAEEEAVDQVKAVPFLLEDKIQSLGGKYQKAAEAWGPKVVVDGKLITGQNPASAGPIGEALVKALAA